MRLPRPLVEPRPRGPRAPLGDGDVEQVVGRELVVPDVEEPGVGIVARSGCGTPSSAARTAPSRFRRRSWPRGPRASTVQAGDHPHHVPFERTREGLVEVTEIERQLPFRRRPQPEVEDVGVPAQLHRQPAVRPRGQVGGHHRRGTAVVVHGDAAMRPWRIGTSSAPASAFWASTVSAERRGRGGRGASHRGRGEAIAAGPPARSPAARRRRGDSSHSWTIPGLVRWVLNRRSEDVRCDRASDPRDGAQHRSLPTARRSRARRRGRPLRRTTSPRLAQLTSRRGGPDAIGHDRIVAKIREQPAASV